MSEVKNTRPSKAIRIILIGAVVLTVGILLFNILKPEPAPSVQSANNGLKLPAAANPANMSGSGNLQTNSNTTVPQALNGKSINTPQAFATGKVVDAQGKSVPDVRVQCISCQTSAAVALSDPAGNFRLPYRFEPQGDNKDMVIMVSKSNLSTKHIVQPGNTGRLQLELK